MANLTWDQIGPLDGEKPFFHTDASPAAPAIRGDRLFLGNAKRHGQQTDGTVTNGSWLQSFEANGVTVTGWDYFEDIARGASVSDFGVAFSGISRTSGGLDGIGLAGVVLNDSASNLKAWGGYFDAVKAHTGAGITHGVEINATNLPGVSPLQGLTPYKAYAAGMVGVLNLAVGSDASVFGRSYAADWFINMGNNGGAAQSGIVFRSNSLLREDPTTGLVTDNTTDPGNVGLAGAIRMAHEHCIGWFSRYSAGSPGDGGQQEVVRIYSTVDAADVRMEMVFSDLAISFNEKVSPGSALLQVGYLPNAGTHVFIQPAIAGQAARIQARGLNPNNNLFAEGSGTGLFGFGEFTSGSDAPITGYVTIATKDGIIRKLAVIA